MLSGIMLIACFVFIFQFLHYSPFPEVYPYFDSASILGGLVLFPLFHIYFRLLLAGENFSWRIHIRYLLVPIGISLVYWAITLVTPKDQYRFWLYNEIDRSASSTLIRPLQLVKWLVRITFLTQFVVISISNFLLIIKYREKSKSLNESTVLNTQGIIRLNTSVVSLGIACIATAFPGFSAHISQNVFSSIIWLIFSVSLFIIGLSVVRQMQTRPSPAAHSSAKNYIPIVESSKMQNIYSSKIPKDQLMTRIMDEFERKKIFLNSDLGIMDVAGSIGSNRTYISEVIKENFNQNFCGFVNAFRLRELERILIEDSKMTTEKIAESCGFGTVNSMKRAVFSRTGLSFHEYRQQFNGNGPEI